MPAVDYEQLARFSRLAEEAGFMVESVRADFTATEYSEGQCRTAVWTLRSR